MAKVLKKVKTVEKKKLRKGTVISDTKYALPTTPSVIAENIIDYSFLIYGRKKIGKTSLVARFDKSLFFMFEPGTKAQSVYQVPRTGCFTEWKDVRGFVRTLQKGAHEFITGVFDPGNKAYDLCLKYVCIREGISHPGKMKDYGASWKLVSAEFEDIHLQLANAGLAFIVIAHEKFDDEKQMIVPRFSNATDEFYEGVIDNIFYYHYVGSERFLQIRGTEEITAGTRCEGRFMTVDGRPIFKIPMGKNADEAYNNLLSAWDNNQHRSYGPDEEEEKPKKKKKLILKKSRA